jgi:MFS family permease
MGKENTITTVVSSVPPSPEPFNDLENGGKTETEAAAEWKAGPSELAAMITIAVISLMVALDATILVPALPALATDLHGSATDAFWAGSSYLLTSAVFQPFIAALSDIFGRKEMLLVSLFFFTLGTLLCAPIAKDFTALLAGRSIQGIGGGGIITMGQVIYADIVPLRQRPKYFSLVLGAWAVGSVIGPLVGGLFVEHVSWRWCFYINVRIFPSPPIFRCRAYADRHEIQLPFCGLGFAVVPLFVKLTTTKSSLISKLRRVDWTGGALFVGGLTTFLIGLSWAGIQYAWSSAQTIAPMVIGACFVVLSIVWECKWAKEPFLTVSLFYSPSAIAAFAGAFCNGFMLFCAMYYAPLYFMGVRFTTPTESGTNLIPVTAFLLPGSILVSVLTTRLGRFRWAIWIGWTITCVGSGLLLLLNETTPTPVWAVIFAVFGIGSGMVLTGMNVSIQAISRVEDCGRAGSMYAFLRTLGMTVGVAVGGTTFQNVMLQKLKDLGLPEEIAYNAEAYIAKLAQMPATSSLRIGVVAAYVQGIHGVFWVVTGAAIFGLLASFIIRAHSMDKILASKFSLEGGVAQQHARTETRDTAKSGVGLLSSPTLTTAEAEKRFSRADTAIVEIGQAQVAEKVSPTEIIYIAPGAGSKTSESEEQQLPLPSTVSRPSTAIVAA